MVLTDADFVYKEPGYYSFTFKDYELTLKPCLNGFDVAIYRNEELLEPKVCTDINVGKGTLNRVQANIEALKKANELYKKYNEAKI